MPGPSLYTRIDQLPDHLKDQVDNYVAFLEQKYELKPKIKERKLGYAKGFFEMMPDFDEPLEDFKDYM